MPGMPVCPKCHRDDFITTSGDNHYVCTYDDCPKMESGVRSQFHFREDEQLRFPYNIIFSNRQKNEFFRVPYIAYAEK